MNKEVKGEHKVTQSHALVESLRDVHPLTLQESRIVMTAISLLQPSDTVFDSQRILAKDFLKLCNMSGNNHKVVEKACNSLFGKGIRIKDPDGKGFTNYPWFQKIKYLANEGVIEFQFPNDIQSFLLELKKEEGFTSYRLEYILRLSSPYYQRIYELCFKWKHAGVCEFELDHLKDMIGAVKKTYDSYGPFKQKVLIPAMKEINEKTDIDISFEEVKTGRKVTSIIFFIKSKKEKKENKKKDTPSFKKKIIREEPIPKFFNERDTKLDIVYGKFSKEEIDMMRKQLIEERTEELKEIEKLNKLK